MAILVHELWEWDESDEHGSGPLFCLAGPDGERARRELMPRGARLTWTVQAGSHYEAMSKYYAHMGWGEYTTNQDSDSEPYPEEWLEKQQGA